VADAGPLITTLLATTVLSFLPLLYLLLSWDREKRSRRERTPNG
jgi:hypothetical protein